MSLCCPIVLLDLLDLVIAVAVVRTWYLCDVVDDRDVVVNSLVCVERSLRICGVLIVSLISFLVKLGFSWFVYLMHSAVKWVSCLRSLMGVIAGLRHFIW